MEKGIEVYPYVRRSNKEQSRKYRKGDFFLLMEQWLGFKEWMYGFCGLLLGQALILGIAPFGAAFFAYRLYRGRQFPLLTLIGVLSGWLLALGWQETVFFAMALLAVFWSCNLLGRKRLLLLFGALLLVIPLVMHLLFKPGLYNYLNVLFSALLAELILYIVIEEDHNGVGLALMGIGMLLGLKGLEIADFSIQNLISALAIITAAHLGGMAPATIAGVVVGLIPSFGGTLAPLEVAYQSLAGLLAGLFTGKRWMAAAGFLAARIFFSFYIVSPMEVVLELKEAILAAAIFLIIPGRWLERLAAYLPPFNTSETASWNSGTYYAARVKRLADLLEGIFKNTKDISDEAKRRRDPEISELLNRVSCQVCKNCSRFTLCWEKDFYSTYRELLRLFGLTDEIGRIDSEHIGGVLERRCSSKKELITAINCLSENYLEKCFLEEKVIREHELLQEQMRNFARALQRTANQLSAGADFDFAEKRRLENGLRHLAGVTVEGVKLTSRGLAAIVGGTGCNGEMTCDKVKAAAEDIWGETLVPEIFNCGWQNGTECCGFELLPAPGLVLKYGFAGYQKEGNNVSGDSYEVFLLNGAVEAVALSDGMGTGEPAARDSQLTLTLVRQFLEAGFPLELALRSVNDTLTWKFADDVFCTLDLILMDLASGQVSITKAGAAPSFLLRNGKVEVIAAGHLPMGIFKEWQPKIENKMLFPGDMLLMISDGIIDAERSNESWLENFLSSWGGREPQQLADAVLQCALTGKENRDDMTVIAARVDLS